MVFKNQKELEAFLLQKCKVALERSQNQVYKIIDLYLNRFYADYDPVWYDRTGKLLRSLVKSDIKKDGKGYKAEIYFDLDYSYNTGSNPSGEQVMDAASYGGHGAEGLRVVAGDTGVNIWNDPIQQLDAEAINILVDMLMAEGIPVKKG